ncbi:hypothetical protein DDB_G0272514 [Dictyostelium discoideum AX4]|uniref:Uncharacterized protein DDB_G0272514 n=1 Tax=Dictyostelium discoideum TaxID=44689 RepID=Y8862_DICDI|nr:hypothetical protein DDB_G0272514 [Dictyostelium discoideum AX4]Q7KWT8.1 RecName: Full=Uncharacterized protein DDB_G0272514 [Dictyostelium discoideum]EAL71181.1 hypothetical protein DDB_G0272514 [Dictyostelium discoideum AX4]|eukprot:XP_645128.1 hypothetical protein DDB_G0272514 [Dictyostelium discoideum AX4]
MDSLSNYSNSLSSSGEISNKFAKIGSSILYGYYDYLTATSRVLHGEDKIKNTK